MTPHAHRNPSINQTRSVLILACVVAFFAIQVAVPTVRLFSPRPARFGWQMYSSLGQHPTFWVVARDGTSREVALKDEVGYVRLDIDYIATLPHHLCDTTADIIAVRYQRSGSTEIVDYPCP